MAVAPGQPFDPATVLDAMRDSRRPDGVPDQLETDAIAAALAERIWTIDGQPWTTMSAGGSCGPVRCTLEISGSRAGGQGEDLWIFEVIPAGGEVAVIETNLRSVPSETADAVDRLARAADPRIDDAGLLLVSVRWLPPPDDETFELSYRSGNEEGLVRARAHRRCRLPRGRLAERDRLLRLRRPTYSMRSGTS